MTHLARISQILVALFVIWLISMVIASQPSSYGFVFSFCAVFGFWIATSLILVVLSVRLEKTTVGANRFRFSTILLVVLYIALYLAPIRFLMRERGVTETRALIWMLVQGLGFAWLLTIIQLHVAKSFVLTLISLRNYRQRGRNSEDME